MPDPAKFKTFSLQNSKDQNDIIDCENLHHEDNIFELIEGSWIGAAMLYVCMDTNVSVERYKGINAFI